MEDAVKIPGFPKHSITKSGVVYGVRGNVLSQYKRPDGYLEIKLYCEKESKVIRKNCLVHRLVAITFICEDDEKIVNHKNGIKTDNRLENLEWATIQENTQHAWDNSLIKKSERRVYKISIEDGSIIGEYFSIKEAAEKNDLKLYNISKVCRGVLSQTGGWKWKYADEENDEIPLDCKSWKEIAGFPDYLISKEGVVFSKKRNKIIKPCQKAYLVVGLYNDDGNRKVIAVHILVAKAYIPNPKSHPVVNHIDGNKYNNNHKNLEWVTHQQNSQHACDTGLCKKPEGKAVVQYDTSEKEIERFNTITEASLKTKAQPDVITRVCNSGKGTAGGYRWRWLKDVEEE